MFLIYYIKHYYRFLPIIFILSACVPENPFLSKSEVEQLDNVEENRSAFNLAMIINNDIYFVSDKPTSPAIQLTFDGLLKSCVKLSSDENHIAYLDKDGHVNIINAKTGVNDEVKTDKVYKEIGWIDENSLYFFDGEEFSFYGNEVTAPDLSELLLSSQTTISSACVNINGEYAYILTTNYGAPYYSTSQKLIVGTTNDSRTINYSSSYYDYLIAVYFNPRGDLCVLTSSDKNTFLFDNMALITDVSSFVSNTQAYITYFFEDLAYDSYVFYDYVSSNYSVAARLINGYYNIDIIEYGTFEDTYVIDTISNTSRLSMDIR